MMQVKTSPRDKNILNVKADVNKLLFTKIQSVKFLIEGRRTALTPDQCHGILSLQRATSPAHSAFKTLGRHFDIKVIHQNYAL